MHAKQIGCHLILPAFQMVEYGQVLAQRLLQPKDVDAGVGSRQPASTSFG